MRGVVAAVLILGLAAAPAVAAKATVAQRVAAVQKLLGQAAGASKKAPVKQGIATASKMVAAGQYAPAKAKVAALKRAAALAGDSSAVVLKLVRAEDALGDLLQATRRRPRRR